MLPLEIPAGTTIESLVRRVVPELHARLVPDEAPGDPFTVAVRIEPAGSWTVVIRGRAMIVEDGEPDRPTLWMYTTARAVERFIEDATGPRRFVPKFRPSGGVTLLSDPRVVKRVAMASGRVEMALRDVDDERLAIVVGFGAAAKKPIDPEDADVVVEVGSSTAERVLAGALAPEQALADGDVKVRGNRLLAVQLALAVAPFYPPVPR
jgi:hypothetical protein